MIHITEGNAKLSNLNLRVEKLGKEKTRPAADLKFTIDVPNTQLDQIHPGLLNSLYKRADEQGHQADLTAPDPSTLTTPRYPKAKAWASTEDWPGYSAVITSGTFAVDQVEIEMVTLKGITAEALNGGTARLSFTISGNPDAEDVGALYTAMGHEVELTLQPPSIGDLASLREQAKAKPTDDDDDDDQTAPGADVVAGRAFPDAIDARGDGPRSKASLKAVH